MINWQSYSAMCKEKNIDNPYRDEAEFNRAYGIDDTHPPLYISRKNASHRNIEPTLSNHEAPKVSSKPLRVNLMDMPKKPQAVREPRKTMTPEEARLRRNQLQRERNAAKREGAAKRSVMSDEEKRQYHREYMRRFRALHPNYQVEANRKWREKNPEKRKVQIRRELEVRKVQRAQQRQKSPSPR